MSKAATTVLTALALAAVVGLGCGRGGGGAESTPPKVAAPPAAPAPAMSDAASEPAGAETAALIEAIKARQKDAGGAAKTPCKSRKGKRGEERCIPPDEMKGPVMF